MKEKRLARKTLPEVRARFVRMVDAGLGRDAVMVALGLKRATYYGWLGLYRRGGVAALEVRPVPGGPPKLSDRQLGQLRGWVVGKDPRQFRFDFALWTRKIVRDLVRDRFGVQMTPQGVGRMLARMGLSPQRPLYRAYQQNPEAVAAWKAERYPAIQAEAAKAGARIFFADEASVRWDFHAGTTWAPIGRTPVVPATGKHFTVNMVSAVAANGTLHFDLFDGRMDSAAFIAFCKKLLKDCPTPVFLIVDGASYHTSHETKKFAESTEGRLRLFQLPAYSPELNPDEWVWNNVKNTQLGRKSLTRKTDLAHAARQALTRLQQLPETVRGFFGDPSLAYITNALKSTKTVSA